MVPPTHVVLVGACAVDTILIVPYFPSEDSKLRAVSATKRRGGNCPNTLEVLHQLIQLEKSISTADERGVSGISNLILVSPMPSKASPIMPFMYESFKIEGKKSRVDFSHCIYREDHVDPVSSYIISSQATGSRTIVSHSPLPEMTYEEFICIANSVHIPLDRQDEASVWFHFEGRIPDTTLACMRYLRQIWQGQKADMQLVISVELEKPGREGLQDLAGQADVVFYSRSWAEGEGYTSSSECLLQQARVLEQHNESYPQIPRILICTWDKLGACGLMTALDQAIDKSDIVHSLASVVAETEIVDTVGAGDTFIAGMLFGLINKNIEWSLEQKLDFANALAGNKIKQQGFWRLAEQLAERL